MNTNKHLNGYVGEDLEDEAAYPAEGFIPKCKYCGATRLPMAMYHSQEEADEDATISCNCIGAAEHRREIEKQKERETNLLTLNERLDELARYCEEKHVPFTDGLRQTLVDVGTLILDHQADSITSKWCRMKVSFKLNAKGRMQVRYSHTDTGTMEV